MRALDQRFRGALALGSALAAALACDPAPAAERSAPEPAAALRPEGVRGPIPADVRVADYVLDARLDAEAHRVTGTARITWRNRTSHPTAALPIHLYMNAFRAEDTAWMLEARGSHRGERQGDEGRWGTIDLTAARLLARGAAADLPALEGGGASPTPLAWREEADPSLATIDLPAPVGPGEAITLEIEFVTQLPRVFARTGYAGDFHMLGQWYPKLGVLEEEGWKAHVFTLYSEFYADFGDYEVRLDVPEDMVVGATGILVDAAPPAEGRKRLTYRAELVHDFAWAASPDLLEYGDTWRDVRIRQLVPRALAADAPQHLEALIAALESMDRRFGPYPWSTLTVVHPPEIAGGAQGMEYPTLFTTSEVFRPPLPLRLLGLHERIAGEFTTIHEFGHQYFQGLLASDESAQPWLDEGVNSTANNLVLLDWLGEDGAIARLGNQRLGFVDFTRLGVQLASSLDPVDTPAATFRDFAGSYGATVYRKTAALLLTLRRLVGDAPWDAAMRAYADAQRFRHPTGDDLVAAFLRELGPQVLLPGTGPEGQPVTLDLREFFHQGLRTTAAVDFEVARLGERRLSGGTGWHRDPAGQLVLTEPEADAPDDPAARAEATALIVRKGEFRVPVEVEAEFTDGSAARVTWDGQARYRLLSWPGKQLRRVTLDPDDRLLLEGVRLNNRKRAAGQGEGDGVSGPLAGASEAAALVLLGGLAL